MSGASDTAHSPATVESFAGSGQKNRRCAMQLRLVIEVPNNADQSEVLRQLMNAVATREGISITTARRYYTDVDLVRIENLGDVGDIREGLVL